jgi:hypothetical protein
MYRNLLRRLAVGTAALAAVTGLTVLPNPGDTLEHTNPMCTVCL